MKELIAAITALFPETKEFTILCSKELYQDMLKKLNASLLSSSDNPILIKSFEMNGKTFNIREGLSVEKGFKIEF